jgi:hypothetical protein
MAAKKSTAARNAKTGSYTVHVPKSAATGKFVSESSATGRIVVRGSAKKAS